MSSPHFKAGTLNAYAIVGPATFRYNHGPLDASESLPFCDNARLTGVSVAGEGRAV
jgi:hypothetical protein